MIRLNVFIRTTDSNREELISTVKELAAASLKDEGCVAYDLFESATRRDVLMICETWPDDEHEQKIPDAHCTGDFSYPESRPTRLRRRDHSSIARKASL